MTKDKYRADYLFIATPSKIKDVKGQFIRGKRPHEPQRVVQTATFETLPMTIVTYGSPSPYEDVIKEELTPITQTQVPARYYDARNLEHFGISIEDQTKKYVYLTDDDLIPFQHFMLSVNSKQVSTITFFQRPFWKKQKAQTTKRTYTAEELEEIAQNLATPYKPKTLVKRYSSIRQDPTFKVINGSVFKTSRKYAGTNDDFNFTVNSF